MMTLTSMFFSMVKQTVSPFARRCFSNRCAILNLDALRRVVLPVVVQPPRTHFRRPAAHYADDDVAVPGPGVFTVELARLRGVVGMRVIPSHHVEPLPARSLFRFEHIFCGDREAIAGRIVAAIHERKKLDDLARRPLDVFRKGRIATEQCTAAFVRKCFGTMLADAFRQFVAKVQAKIFHLQSSSQNRSLKYFVAESAKTVTSTARSRAGIFSATASVPTRAAAALGLTSRPSSRARRFTMRYAPSVEISRF